jgi:hypothetical protein
LSERTTKPDKLHPVIDKRIAEKNREVIKWINKKYTLGSVYASWGANIEKHEYLLNECQYIVDTLDTEYWYTRGTTKYGRPKHPLYVSYEEKLEYFPVQDYLWKFDMP